MDRIKRLVIVRHGNTFTSEQTPTRVGAKTDLPLVEKARGTSVGFYLKEKDIFPDKVFSAPLKRTMETAKLVVDALGKNIPIIEDHRFVEIDYGPDENHTEEEVLLRLGILYSRENAFVTKQEAIEKGKEIIDKWNSEAIVPNGWIVDVKGIIQSWRQLSESIQEDETVMVVSSNGIIRFAPYILDDYAAFCSNFDIKVATGSVSIFEYQKGKWNCCEWGTKCYKLYK